MPSWALVALYLLMGIGWTLWNTGSETARRHDATYGRNPSWSTRLAYVAGVGLSIALWPLFAVFTGIVFACG